jgi:catecholate siderophore receptor
MIEYNAKNYAIKANVFNLFNKRYFESVYSGHAIYGTSRAVQVTFTAKF